MPMHNTAQGGHEAKPDGAESRYLDLESSRERRCVKVNGGSLEPTTNLGMMKSLRTQAPGARVPDWSITLASIADAPRL